MHELGSIAASDRLRKVHITFSLYSIFHARSYGYELPSDVQYYFSQIQCPTVKDYTTEGETVLLRCSHPPVNRSDNISAVCTKSELAAVKCSKLCDILDS